MARAAKIISIEQARKPLKFDGKRLEVFGALGYRLDQMRWFIKTNSFCSIISPDPIGEVIEKLIEDNFIEERIKEIDHIPISPQNAIRLFLEGRITEDHIKRSVTDFKRVVFQGIGFRVYAREFFFRIAVAPSFQGINLINRHGKVLATV